MGNGSNKVDDNVIVYNLKATNLKYQSLFIRGDIYSPPSLGPGHGVRERLHGHANRLATAGAAGAAGSITCSGGTAPSRSRAWAS